MNPLKLRNIVDARFLLLDHLTSAKRLAVETNVEIDLEPLIKTAKSAHVDSIKAFDRAKSMCDHTYDEFWDTYGNYYDVCSKCTHMENK